MFDVQLQVGEGSREITFSVRSQLTNQFTGIVVTINIRNFQWSFVFENGLLVFDSGGIVLRGPRDVFDQDGYFTLPPIIEHKLVDNDANHSKSIDLSVALFLKTAMGEGVFDLRDRNLSFFSNSLMF